MEQFRHHLERFIKLSDDEFVQVMKFFSKKKLKKGRLLVRVGDNVTSTWWVNTGLLTSTYVDDQGKEHVIQFAIENCWITDQNAFYNKEKALFTITALEDCELLCISYADREEICSKIPKMERFFRKKANDSFAKQQKRLLTYLSSDARKRYDLLISEYPNIMERLSKKVLAMYLGVSRETLSRPIRKVKGNS